jgi:hypothetical protein
MSEAGLKLPSWVPPFLKAWFERGCMNERRRIMLRSRVGEFGLVTNLHDLVVDYLHFKDDAFLEQLPLIIQTLAKTAQMSELRPKLAEQGVLPLIGKQFVEVMLSNDAAKMLRFLAELVDRFPISQGALDFGDDLSMPSWFKPTLQDGLKAVMLGAFLEIVGERPMAPESLPTIGELDSVIREKWKWRGDDKELRDARRALGLSGLPRGKSGRPKKQRGKK